MDTKLAGEAQALIGIRRFIGLREELEQVEPETIPEQLEGIGRDTVYDVIDVLISDRTAGHLRRALARSLPGWLRPFVGLALRAVFPEKANIVLKGLADRLFT